VLSGGTLLATPALDLSTVICSESERGLLGVAVDPQFASNRFIYVYYTYRRADPCSSTNAVNRVSRFVLADTNTVDRASETILIDNIPSTAGNHNGGDLQFGKDANLYISVGDGGCDYAGTGCAGSNDASRDQNVLLGKVLRITPTGAIPAGNPFQGLGTGRCNLAGRTTAARCQETFAWGLRNPFRMAFDPNAPATRFYINDVGQNVWEEIDDGVAGADYGWNVREGHCANASTTNCGAPPAGMTNPIHDYSHAATNCGSITGGAFVPGGVWPAAYDGGYLFGDYVCGRIFALTPAGTRTIFADQLGASSAVHLAFGPHGATQALYYTSYQSGGTVHRIAYAAAGNQAPTARLSATPPAGEPGVVVTLDGSASSDPDAGDTLTYEWDFGDGTAPAQTTASSVTHTYAIAGRVTAQLVVRDDHGVASSAASTTIDVGNTVPQPVMTSPAAGASFYVGQSISLRGSATDREDGTLASSRLSWTVLRRHGTHTHPWYGPVTGNSSAFTAPAPEDLEATANSSVEVILTATDSSGATASVSRVIQPRLVNLTFATSPGGLTLQLNGTSFTASRTWTSWERWNVTVSAPDQPGYAFRRWSDGGARTHTIRTPSSATTYTATFRRR
jgi:glucose/arabinose dehydrogenase